MKVTKISFTLGCTINMGNYENYRPEITIEAEIGAYKSMEGEMGDLQELAKRELALSLWDRAEADLKTYRLYHLEGDRRVLRAIQNSGEFRWMYSLNPKVAADLLNSIVEEQRAKEALEEAERAAQLAVSEPDADEGETDDAAGEPTSQPMEADGSGSEASEVAEVAHWPEELTINANGN